MTVKSMPNDVVHTVTDMTGIDIIDPPVEPYDKEVETEKKEEEKPKKVPYILAKKELDMLKYHLSSIFGRKHKFIYIDNNKIDTWHFTSIPPDWGYCKTTTGPSPGVFIHKNTIDSHYHTVTIKDMSIIELLTRLLPVVGERPVCIVVNELMAIVNKKATDQFIYKDDGIYFEKSQGKKDPTEVRVIGYIDDVTVDFVAGIVKEMISRIDHAKHKSDVEIPKTLLDKSKVTHFTVDWPNQLPDGSVPKIDLPLCDGFNIVCCNEYLKRVPEEHTLTATIMADQAAVRFIVRFENTKVSIVSGIPSAIWFPKAV
jgi:hypothetical protein